MFPHWSQNNNTSLFIIISHFLTVRVSNQLAFRARRATTSQWDILRNGKGNFRHLHHAKYVFKCFLKEFKESVFLKDADMLFHNLGPARENLRSTSSPEV